MSQRFEITAIYQDRRTIAVRAKDEDEALTKARERFEGRGIDPISFYVEDVPRHIPRNG